MQAKAKPTGMQSLPNQNFRFGVLATNRRHAVTTLALTKRIWHGKYFHKVEENIGSIERFNRFFPLIKRRSVTLMGNYQQNIVSLVILAI
jgi:hypothetical protein